MGKLNARGDISFAALAVFVPIAIASVYVCFKHLNIRRAYYYVYIFAIIKIIAAAMTINVQLASNKGLFTVSAILTSAVLSPLLGAVSEFMRPVVKTSRSVPDDSGEIPRTSKEDIESSFPRYLRMLFGLNSLVIVASLALAIVGGIDAFNADRSKWAAGKSFLRAAAGLWILSFVIIVVVAGLLWPKRQQLGQFRGKAHVIVVSFVVPMLALRIGYSAANAWSIDTTKTQVFEPWTGSWVLYLCLAFLPEVAIAAMLVGIGLLWAKSEV